MTQKQKPAPAQKSTRGGVYVVEKYTHNGEERENWIRIGVAFKHGDGKGYKGLCKATPVNGEFVIRDDDPQEGGGE